MNDKFYLVAGTVEPNGMNNDTWQVSKHLKNMV